MTTLQEISSSIRRVDKMIENDLEEHFQVWVPLSSNVVKYKEGIHFPIISELIKIVKENEDLKQEGRVRRQKDVEEARRNHGEEVSEVYEDGEK